MFLSADLVAILKKKVSVQDINAAMKKASETSLKGILEYTEDPIVSSDVIGNAHSCVFDADSTMSLENDTLVKILGLYDNEWGYSNRVVDLMDFAWKV